MKKLFIEEHKSVKLGYAYHMPDSCQKTMQIHRRQLNYIHTHQMKTSTKMLI